MKKVGFYSPYWDQLGGGERYLLGIVEYFLNLNYQVDIFWHNQKILKKFKSRFGLKLSSKINLKKWQYLSSGFSRLQKLKKYQHFFYLTDGSLFLNSASKSVLIVQSPAHFPQPNLKNQIKLLTWNQVWTYSHFVRQQFEKKVGKTAKVVAPFVDLKQFKPGKKEKLILSVGRYFSQPHNKKHQFLIKAFKELNKKTKGWRLVLAGSLKKSDQGQFNKLKKQAKGSPIEVLSNLSFKQVKKLYQSTSIYWHATGYNENLDSCPEKAEHFGITTIEAMASGAVPVVINAGGLKEIVAHNSTGILWQTEQDLINYTLKLIKKPKLRKKLGVKAQDHAQKFSKSEFFKNLEKQL